MPSQPDTQTFPFDQDELAILHNDFSYALEDGLMKMGEALSFVFGDETASTVMHSLFLKAGRMLDEGELQASFEQAGWRQVAKDDSEDLLDTINLTQFWREGVEYAGQGIAPREPRELASLEDREKRVRMLVARARKAREVTPALFGNSFDYVWKAVAARAAIDFGGVVTLKDLELLSGLSTAVIRNAVSTGDLRPDALGGIGSGDATAWLVRRRSFCTSRWKNPSDNQYSFDRDEITEPNQDGMIFVPQAAEGEAFTPDLVVRQARGSPGISITIGAKGEEVQHDDFYQALVALSVMPVARWRRRNTAGNWGIVRARGAWIAMSKADVDRQLAGKMAGDR